MSNTHDKHNDAEKPPPVPKKMKKTVKHPKQRRQHWENLCRRARRGGRRPRHKRQPVDLPFVGLRPGLLIGAPEHLVHSITEYKDPSRHLNERAPKGRASRDDAQGQGAPAGRAPQGQNENTRGDHEGSSQSEEVDRVPSECLVMASLHYTVSASIGLTHKATVPTQVVLDTGAGHNVIRRSSLPKGWQDYVTTNKDLPTLCDASGHVLSTTSEVLLRVRFGNALYRVTFVVVDKLSCPVLLGTRFLNRHCDAIHCRKGTVAFTGDVLPILGRHAPGQPWQDPDRNVIEYHEYVTLQDGTTVRTGKDNGLTSIKLASQCVLPPTSQTQVLVTTRMRGLIVTEPKGSLSAKFHVRAMNSVHEVQENKPFTILLSNFSKRARRFPKGMIVAFATRSPIAYVSLSSGVAHEVGAMLDLFPQTQDPAAHDTPHNAGAVSQEDAEKDPDYLSDADLLALLRTGDPSVPHEQADQDQHDQAQAEQKDNEAPRPTTETIEVPTEASGTTLESSAGGTGDDATADAAAEKPEDPDAWKDDIDLSHIHPSSVRRRCMRILEKHKAMFSGQLGTVHATEHRIELKPDTAPIRQQPYRAGPEKREQIREQIAYQLAAGVIEPAFSEWASPVLLAPKKDGTMRFCIDFRRLNAVTIPDTYPLPRMDDCIDSLSHAKVFSMLDALWGYWQIPIAEKDRDKTTFTSHVGTYRYTRMPFGLRNAPSTFQRALDVILSGVRWKICLVYLDDVIIFSRDEKEHLDHLDTVLTLLEDAGIKLKSKKCFFMKKEVEYLGHCIRPGTLGVCRDAKAIRAIRDAVFPQTYTTMKSFLGCCNVYRRFVRGFATISSPLSDMLKKDSQTDWDQPIVPTEQQQEAFETLKSKLIEPPILALPKPGRPYMVDCDASKYGIGAVLLQQQDESKPTEWATVGYFSKTLSKEQRNYSATERECYAVVWAVLTLRPYLEGSHFIVRTDHNALRWMMTLNDPTGRLMRWRLRLLEFDYEILYRPGRVHQVPDALSRLRRNEDSDDESDIDDELPTFPVGKPATVEDILHVVQAVTRSRTRQTKPTKAAPKKKNQDAQASDPAAAEPPKEKAVPHGKANTEGTAVAKPFVRKNKVASADKERTWKDTTFLPLPGETSDDEDDEQDLIADARDIIMASRMEADEHGEHGHDDTENANLPAPLERSEILAEQKKDEFCQAVMTEQVGRKGSCFFEADDGVLCRQDLREPGHDQVVLPATLKHRVLRLAHYHVQSGHPGQTRMHNRVRRTLYWPHMAADIALTVRECEHCAKNRIRLLKQANKMRLFPATTPLECCAIDILGPLPKSPDGYRFLLVVTDRFTKLTHAFPLKRIKADDVAIMFVNEWVFKYGAPKELVSDNGSQFVSTLFQEACKLLSVDNAFTMTYHPQTNGQAERFNRSLTAMLRCYVEDHPAEWPKYVRALCYAYNSAVHQTTGKSPFELVLTRPPPEFMVTHRTDRRQAAPARDDYLARLEIALGKARESMAKVQARYKKNFDRRVRHIRKLQPTDKVYLDVEEGGVKRSKLSHGVGGAFRIISIDKDTNTLVIQRGDVVERVSMNRVVRAPASAQLDETPDALQATSKDIAEKVTTGQTWVMKRILDHRELDDGSLEFRIDWAGNWRPSWEPRAYIPEEAISRYLARRRKQDRAAVRAPRKSWR